MARNNGRGFSTSQPFLLEIATMRVWLWVSLAVLALAEERTLGSYRERGVFVA